LEGAAQLLGDPGVVFDQQDAKHDLTLAKGFLLVVTTRYVRQGLDRVRQPRHFWSEGADEALHAVRSCGVDVDTRDTDRRRAALDAFGPDPFAATAFEDLTRAAASLLGAPMAAISVLTRAGGHFKAAIGVAGGKRSSDAFATWALSAPTKALVVEDVAKDPEIQKALSEAGLTSIRSFAAVPLTLSSGEAIGALCVMGDSPRKVSRAALKKLKFLGDQVIHTLEERQRSGLRQNAGRPDLSSPSR